MLCGMKLKELPAKLRCDVLIPIVERGEEVIIPDGNFQLQARDDITIVSTQLKMIEFFKKLGKQTAATRDAMIIGGGRTSIYLAKQLLQMGVKVKIIERDSERCEFLNEMLPKAMIICADATEKDVLLEEGLLETGTFVANTNFDEENIMLTLFAKSLSKAKLITRVHRVSYDDIIETMYRLNDNRVEALEFVIKEQSPVVGVPLSELNLKKNMIIGCITHKGKTTIAKGQSVIRVGDTVILITTQTGLHDIRDVVK